MRFTAHLLTRLTGLGLLAALLMSLAICSAAQIPRPVPGEVQPDNSEWEVQQKKEMAKKVNLERQQEIKKDTEKLLELATELKQSVDKTTENTLSLDVIKKAEEIEKLAKSVKEKMKGP